MYLTCDDISTKFINELYKLENLKKVYPDFKVTCFVIAKGLSKKLADWLSQDWIEVAVHGYSHEGKPECERKDREETIRKSFGILKPYLPERFGFRAPGFQMTGTTYPILRKMGFWYIAHQTSIQPLKNINEFKYDELTNSHIYDNLDYDFAQKKFRFISEGF